MRSAGGQSARNVQGMPDPSQGASDRRRSRKAAGNIRPLTNKLVGSQNGEQYSSIKLLASQTPVRE